MLERHGLTPPELSFERFSSLDPSIVELRARQRLRPPETVTLTLRDGTLHAAGVAPRAWITQADLLARALPGIEHFDDRALQAAEIPEDAAEQAKIEALRTAARALETTSLHFVRGSAELTPDTNIANVRSRWDQLTAAADAADLPICVAIVGHADPTGSQRTNQKLSEARADHVARALAADDARIWVLGAGVRHAAQTPEQARSVTFTVDVGTSCPGGDGEAR